MSIGLQPERFDRTPEAPLLGEEVSPSGLLEGCLRDGAVVFSLPLVFNDEVQEVSARLKSVEVAHGLSAVRSIAPRLLTGLVLPLRDMVSAQFTAFSVVEPQTDTRPKKLHSDDVIREGISLLFPAAGDPADFYYADAERIIPDVSVPSLKYGVGRGIMIHQELRLNACSDSDKEQYLPPTYHNGWCVTGPRRLVAVDLHTDEDITPELLGIFE